MSEKMDPEFQIDRRQLLGAGAASMMPFQALDGGRSNRNDAKGDSESARLFAVAYRHHVRRVETYETFERSLRGLFEEDVEPALARDRPNLVCFPEALGLMAMFVGRRGRVGRRLLAENADEMAAVVALGAPYGPQVAYYESKFPGATSAGRYLLLALTDTVVRAVIEPAKALAAEYDCHVAVCTWLPEYERVTGPRAELLADPELDTDYAYEATSGDVLNRNYIFGPDGSRVDEQEKVYLVPIERQQEDGLGVVGLGLDDLPVVDTLLGSIGTVISKDAWMPDVNDRLEQLGADVLLQPEAFDSWGAPGDDMWLPDKFQRGGWWMLQKHAGLAYNVTGQLTGNFGASTFDGQPFVAGTAPERSASCLLGQPPEPGWLAVGDWNSLEGTPEDWCGTDRRRDYAAVGRAMQPGSGSELENAYAEDVVYADVTVPTRSRDASPVARGNFESSVPIDPQADADSYVPALTATPSGAACTWIDFRRDDDHVVYAATTTDGFEWSTPVAVTDREPRVFDQQSNQWKPTGAYDDGLVTLFGDFRTENWDIYGSHSRDGRQWSANERVDDAERVDGPSRERGHTDPLLLSMDECLVAIWSDLRWPFVKPQIRVARSFDGGETWSETVRADGQPVAAPVEQPYGRSPAESNGQAYPTASVHQGTLLVAWQELTADGPGIFLVRSTDNGETFTSPERMEDTGGWRPSLGGDGHRAWLVWETEQNGGRLLESRRRSATGSWASARPVDPSPPAGVRQRYASVVGTRVVFEDDRTGTASVLVSPLEGGHPSRVDDSSAAARAPAAVEVSDGRLLVAWQDTRDGERVRIAAERAAEVSG